MSLDVRANFGRIWPVHVSSLTSFLLACRKAFDGDMELFLVLAIIGDRTFSQRNADQDVDFNTWQSAIDNCAVPENINVQCIADYSGIPRETVRRKVCELMRRDWVVKDERGSLSATLKCRLDLEVTTNEAIRYIESMFRVMERCSSQIEREPTSGHL